MAMQFWEAKRQRRLRTTLYLFIYFLLACAVGILFELAMRFLAAEGYTPPMPYLGIGLVCFICIVSCCYYLSYAGLGGGVVATSMGGWQVTRATATSSKEIELLNSVEEMAIASRLPMPAVYIVQANEINAFAAGIKPQKAAVTVTTGALSQLTREELQGVIAHEFGHIASGDMALGMRLAALLMGFFLVFYIGIRIWEGTFFLGREEKKGNAVGLIALVLVIAGVILWFAGTILRAAVSRQREYMADASAVEFTRNPHGIASALRKLDKVNSQTQDMPKSSMGYSHLFLDNRSFWSLIFATHPPLSKRIALIEGKSKKP